MTKQEISKILILESEAWDALCEAEYYYVRERFPRGYGYTNAQLTEYFAEDNDLRAHRASWAAYSRVLEVLGLCPEYTISASARKYSQLTWQWLEGIK